MSSVANLTQILKIDLNMVAMDRHGPIFGENETEYHQGTFLNTSHGLNKALPSLTNLTNIEQTETTTVYFYISIYIYTDSR